MNCVPFGDEGAYMALCDFAAEQESFLDYHPTELLGGLGFAVTYLFLVYYVNVGVPALMLLITIIKSIIYMIKRRKKDGDS